MQYSQSLLGTELVLDEKEDAREILRAIIAAAAQVPWWPTWAWDKGLGPEAIDRLINLGDGQVVVNADIVEMVPVLLRIIRIDSDNRRFRICPQSRVFGWRAEPILDHAREILASPNLHPKKAQRY